jgi:hypothetical protein
MKKAMFLIAMVFVTMNGVAQWTTHTSTDEMTGDKSFYAVSPDTKPTKAMGFPYADVFSNIVVGWNDKSQWVYFWFSDDPNLLNSETEDGYNLITARVKWDDNPPESIVLYQEWSSKFVAPWEDDEGFIKKLKTHNALLLELSWYGNGKVYFRYNLRGSSSKIK